MKTTVTITGHQPGVTGPAAHFARNMHRLRDQHGMSQDQLAKAITDLGLPFYQATAYKIEYGKRHLRLTEAVAIAHVLGSTVDEMVQPHTADQRDPLGYWRARALKAETRIRNVIDALTGAGLDATPSSKPQPEKGKTVA